MDTKIQIEPVKLHTTWVALFGEKRNQMPDDTRRERWEQWKKMATDSGDEDVVRLWQDASACGLCKHLDKDWCKAEGLPVALNNVTFQFGMACAGLGKEID